MNLVEVREGEANLLVPDPASYTKDGKFDPSWAPVFYNPRMRLNRDLSVIMVKLNRVRRALDAFTASGVRAIRYSLEGKAEEVNFNDIDPIALELARKNAELNGVKGRFLNLDARAAMFNARYDWIDIDPFGTPAPFLLDGTAAIIRKGILAVTATDLTALEGAAPRACLRKYGSVNDGLSSSKEIGVRVLLGSLVRAAAVAERYIEPMLSFYADHYIRVFVRVLEGASKADQSLRSMGFVYECPNCLYMSTSKIAVSNCPKCGGRTKLAGPLWLDRIEDQTLLENVQQEVLSGPEYSKKALEIVSKLRMEINFPYWRLDKLASMLKVPMPSRTKLFQCLREIGRHVTETHFDYRGFKTDANYDEIVNCVKVQS
ncbi:N2,N2-dimethylguanosine tRNA methyltransferase [Sulfodiicoccus acidiphilus]|uniref:tRNA (guanine(26)-N(2))-dimethyltransferase n=1 Tax=Sulfodiicoccus acidiphilus TaxID=1670455 RepID=A0A348B3A2_9CREN|nr:tRNA (guanine(10)-N(2))-dimethyltransferase [Sulfodiicoccus acidiphilus]BBD72654.1 N2,N2-dimethylguanosine tRNA methyltransferase [Sulfodiicoccus acidiphilus]GGT95670.1 N2,N2-dimethylguanosine tRNA methyltransferase [Sulfodiicoccus acidiphilus]